MDDEIDPFRRSLLSLFLEVSDEDLEEVESLFSPFKCYIAVAGVLQEIAKAKFREPWGKRNRRRPAKGEQDSESKSRRA